MAKKGMSKDEAKELYKDFRQAMEKMKSDPVAKAGARKSNGDLAKEIAMAIKSGMKKDSGAPASAKAAPSSKASSGSVLNEPSISRAAQFEQQLRSGVSNGRRTAFAFFILLALAKFSVAFVETAQIFSVDEAQAKSSFSTLLPIRGKDERILLTKLDERRAELEAREEQLAEIESELARKNREFAGKLVEIRELTDKLKLNREKGKRKKENQLDQLANVYGSMNPTEASALMEQLDVTIALALLKRMPEKRIGQILSMMSPERALTLTRMLSEA